MCKVKKKKNECKQKKTRAHTRAKNDDRFSNDDVVVDGFTFECFAFDGFTFDGFNLARTGHRAKAICKVGCLRCTKLCWVGKHNTYYYGTDELPNPRPTQPKKNRLKVAIETLFPTANNFSWVGSGFIYR